MPLVVKYHQTRMTCFSLGGPNGEKGENFEAAAKLWLKPGSNTVTDPAIAKLLLENPEFQKSCEATKKAKANGKLPMGCEVMEYPENWKVAPVEAKGDKPGTEGVLGKNPWGKTPDDAMAQLIADCNDVKQLEEMKKVEDRAPIQTLITERLAAIRKGVTDGDEDDDGAGDLD